MVGILEGWRGLVEDNTRTIEPEEVRGLLRVGGTVLRTSRTNPYRTPEVFGQMAESWKRLGLDALIAVGGEDTLGVAARLHREQSWPIVGCVA